MDLYPDIRTGDDVVDFYAKFGQDSPVKFFYCNRWASICALSVPSPQRSHKFKLVYHDLQSRYLTGR